MTARRRLLVVANRGPITLAQADDGTVVAHRGAGGLVTALRPLLGHHDVTWISAATTPAERALAGRATALTVDGNAVRLRPVAPDPEAYAAFYDEAANPVLWFVQHGLADLLEPGRLARFPAAWEEGYRVVNAAFAAAVADELACAPDAAVLFQDYHLYLAPAAVRAACPEARLAQFVHVPWPAPREWEILPRRIVEEIHDGLLACDSIGFHVTRWREAFLSCCEALGRTGAARAAHVNPIAVDPAEFDALAASPGVAALLARLERGRPRRRVLRVDRTDPSKNAVRGFAAFERLLARRPDLEGAVEMLALLDPSRQTIAEYRDYRAQLEQAAGRVNARFAVPGWTPVTLDVRDDFPASVAAYVDYDVLLVNSVRDGMNLVACEAPLVNRRDGVLVLSTETGAWDALGVSALGIDPLDVDATAAALERALALEPVERRARAGALDSTGRARTPADWVADELAALDERRRPQSARVPSPP